MSIYGNLVNTHSGPKLIQDLKPGALILTHKRRYKKLLKINYETSNKNFLVKTTCRDTTVTLCYSDKVLTLDGFKQVTELEKNSFIAFAEEISYIDFPGEGGFRDDLTELSFCPFNEGTYDGFPRTRYLLEVEDDHSYCCDGIVIHNHCFGDSYIMTSDEIITVSDAYAKLGDRFLTFDGTSHNNTLVVPRDSPELLAVRIKTHFGAYTVIPADSSLFARNFAKEKTVKALDIKIGDYLLFQKSSGLHLGNTEAQDTDSPKDRLYYAMVLDSPDSPLSSSACETEVLTYYEPVFDIYVSSSRDSSFLCDGFVLKAKPIFPN